MIPNHLQGEPAKARRDRGAVLLALLALIIVTTTVATVSRVSLNRQQSERALTSARQLAAAKEALLGYALRRTPPGQLPCPDTDFPPDGDPNPAAGGCQSRRGWLPYRSLSLDQLRDGGGAPLWYAVEPGYTPNAGVALNSTRLSGLTLNGESIIAVVIAPGPEIGGQRRTSAAVDQYLEGGNADADPNTYARVQDETHNDQLLGLEPAGFWSLIERALVLPAVETWLGAFQDACSQYPWAATFGAAGEDSVAGLQGGALPLGAPLPACGSPPAAPAWIAQHWRRQIYYRFCLPTEGACLAVTGDRSGAAALALVAPGVTLPSQSRPSAAPGDYYEDENAAGGAVYRYRERQHLDDNFNDVLRAPGI